MNFLDKISENLSQISFLKKKTVTVFISIEDKIAAKNEDANLSKYLDQKKSIYIEATKIYKPRYLIMYLFGNLFLKKKKGYQRLDDSIPRFLVIQWYREYLSGGQPKHEGYQVIFQQICDKPFGKNIDCHGFEEHSI
ncbi:MAG: hypothetical protein MRY57_01370 [Candidatus Pacebacteria bacterium]|nr:hypothetical protein [Candidatus Paceibacterota bacterium]